MGTRRYHLFFAAAAPPPPAGALNVVNNTIVNAAGIEQPLHGFDITGPEYAPNDATANGLWTTAFSSVSTFSYSGLDGNSDLANPALRSALISYLQTNFPYANCVRIGLNESAWNGLNVAVGGNSSTPGTPTKPYNFADGRYNGPAYQAFMVAAVAAFRAAGYFVILSLFATRPDSTPFGAQNLPSRGIGSNLQAMPNVTHSIPMWTSVATTFAHDTGVIFDLYNEPTGLLSEFGGYGGAAAWDAWLNGANGDRGGDQIVSDGGHISDITTTIGTTYTAGNAIPATLTLGSALPYDVPGGATFLVGTSPNQDLVTVASQGGSGGSSTLPLISLGNWAFSHSSGAIVSPAPDNDRGMRTIMYLNQGYTAGAAIPASISVTAINTTDNPIPSGAQVLVGTSVTGYPVFTTTQTLTLSAPYNPGTDSAISVVTGGTWTNNHGFGDGVKYSPNPVTSWVMAGQNAMISAVRGTGATNIVMCGVPMSSNLYGGWDATNGYYDVLATGWVGYKPTDPLGKTVCSVHLYDSEVNNVPASWTNLGQLTATSAPVVVGETRETTGGAVATYATSATSIIISNSAGFSATGGTATYNGTTFSYSAAVPIPNNASTNPGGVTLTVTGLPQTMFQGTEVWPIPSVAPAFPGNYLEAGWDGLGRNALWYWKRVCGVDNVCMWALTNAGPGGQVLSTQVSAGGTVTAAGVLYQRWMANNRTNSAPSAVVVTSVSSIAVGGAYAASTTCVDGPRSTFTLTGSPPVWLTINAHTGAIAGTVPTGGIFSFSYAVTATNGYGSSTSATVNVTVNPPTTYPVTVRANVASSTTLVTHTPVRHPLTIAATVASSTTVVRTIPTHRSLTVTATVVSTTTITSTGRQHGVWENITPSNISLDTSLGGGNNYGAVSLVVDPANGNVYAGLCYQGIFKSIDHGATWTLVSTGANSTQINNGRPWALTLDPAVRDGSGNPMLVTTCGYNGGNIMWSTNGGVDWTVTSPPFTGGTLSYDLYGIVLDPNRSGHYLIACHSNNAFFEAQFTAGTWTFPTVLTSASAQTPWLLESTGAWFGNTSSTWFVSSDNAVGVYCTTDSGNTWTEVLTGSQMTHGGEYALVNIGGRLWFAGQTVVFATNSTGATAGTTASGSTGWTQISGPGIYYETVISDGTTIWTAQSYPLLGGIGGTWMSYPVSAGLTGSWTFSSTSTPCGPVVGGYDATNHIMYGACQVGGIWALYE